MSAAAPGTAHAASSAAAPSAGAAAPSSRSPLPSPGTPPQDAEGRRRRWLAVAIAVAVLAAVLLSVARGLYRDGPLEPDAPT